MQQWRIVDNVVKVTSWEKCHWLHQNKLLLVQHQVLENIPHRLFMLYIFLPSVCIEHHYKHLQIFFLCEQCTWVSYKVHNTVLAWVCAYSNCLLYEKMPQRSKLKCLHIQIVVSGVKVVSSFTSQEAFAGSL